MDKIRTGLKVILTAFISTIPNFTSSQVPRNIDITYTEREVPLLESPVDIVLITGTAVLIIIYILHKRRKRKEEEEAAQKDEPSE